jgi:hypothetical protein
VAKDKKKKKAKKAGPGKAKSSFKALARNPLVGDVVAAALVATASALKDPKRARALASDASDELGKLSKAGAEAGNALWDMALEIGRRSLEALRSEDAVKPAKPKKTANKSSKKKAPAIAGKK